MSCLFPKAGYSFVSTNMISDYMRADGCIATSDILASDKEFRFYNGDLLFLNHLHSVYCLIQKEMLEMENTEEERQELLESLKKTQRCALLSKMFLTTPNPWWWEKKEDLLMELLFTTRELLNDEVVSKLFVERNLNSFYRGLEWVSERVETSEINEKTYLIVANEFKIYSSFNNKEYVDKVHHRLDYMYNSLPRDFETDTTIRFNLKKVRFGIGKDIDEDKSPFICIKYIE